MRQGNGVFLYSDDGKRIAGIVHPNGEESALELSDNVHAFPFTSYAVQSAIDAIYYSGRPGVVRLAGVPYSITSDITLRPGVSLSGILGIFDYLGYVPDEEPTPTTGTIFNLSPGVIGLKYNNVDQPNPVPAELADTAGTAINIEGITFIGGLRAIHTGAKNILGLHFGKVKNCRFFNQSSEHYIFDNFMHMEFKNLWAWNSLPNVVAGGCVYRASRLRKADSSVALLPGNSICLGTIFAWTNSFLGRGFEITGLDAQLNELNFAAARSQFNRHGPLTAADIVLTANSTQNFVVSDNSQFDLCQIGMPLAIPAGSADSLGLFNGTVYFVVSRDPNTNSITLNDTPLQVSANITASGNGDVAVKCGGFPGLLLAGDPTGSVTASNFGSWDLECKGAVATVVTRNAKGALFIQEIMPSDTNTGFALRNSSIEFEYIDSAPVSMDSSSNVACTFRQVNGGSWTHSSGNITLGPEWNNRAVRYTGSADITVTVPRTLPRGFKCEFYCSSTGQITWVQGTGAVLQKSAATLKTQGSFAETKIQYLSGSSGGTVYKVSGDLGGV